MSVAPVLLHLSPRLFVRQRLRRHPHRPLAFAAWWPWPFRRAFSCPFCYRRTLFVVSFQSTFFKIILWEQARIRQLYELRFEHIVSVHFIILSVYLSLRVERVINSISYGRRLRGVPVRLRRVERCTYDSGDSVRSFEYAVVWRQRMVMNTILCRREVFAFVAWEFRHYLQVWNSSRCLAALEQTAFASAA